MFTRCRINSAYICCVFVPLLFQLDHMKMEARRLPPPLVFKTVVYLMKVIHARTEIGGGGQIQESLDQVRGFVRMSALLLNSTHGTVGNDITCHMYTVHVV